MRLAQEIARIYDTGTFIGENRAHHRVTVEPGWRLTTTGDSVGSTTRGPYRWWKRQDNFRLEVEVPNIKSIEIDRSVQQDVAVCNIQIFNQWHPLNDQGISPSALPQLGNPGHFWFERGKNPEAGTRWDHTESLGAYNQFGEYMPDFSWKNVLIPNAMLRTYQGYGGFDEDNNPLPVWEAVNNTNLLMTGVWLIDSVTAGTDGMLSVHCRDVGRLLLEQHVFPPLAPYDHYPVAYYGHGLTPFASTWGPQYSHSPGPGVIKGRRSEVALTYDTSSVDAVLGYPDAAVSEMFGARGSWSCDGRYPAAAEDGFFPDGSGGPTSTNENTFSFSTGHEYQNSPDAFDYWQFTINGGQVHEIDEVEILTVGGGYDLYISLAYIFTWLDAPGGEESKIIPYEWADQDLAMDIPYVMKVRIPEAAPGEEHRMKYNLPQAYGATTIRFTLAKPMDFGLPTKPYRSGLRDVRTFNTVPESGNIPATVGGSDSLDDIFTYAMARHPVQGYWICDKSGNINGFGEAENGHLGPLGSEVVDMDALPWGHGYYVLEANGTVHAMGDAQHYGDYVLSYSKPGVPTNGEFQEPVNQAHGIAVNYAGDGYWVCYGDGTIRGFGNVGFETTATEQVTPEAGVDQKIVLRLTDVVYFMEHKTSPRTGRCHWLYQRANAICAHPRRNGFWVANGNGQYWAFGACRLFNDETKYWGNQPGTHFGGLYNRTYNKGFANGFIADGILTDIECTVDGDGLWLLFGSGQIAQYGKAQKLGPTRFYGSNDPKMQMPSTGSTTSSFPPEFLFFKALTWSLVRTPHGSGFWIMVANGGVGSYNAQLWGTPSYYGRTGLRWHEGNVDDYSDIVREMAMWGGWWHQEDDPGNRPAEIYGFFEDTAAMSPVQLSEDRWDKKPLMEAIKQVREVVGYIFYIDEQGAINFRSPNWWRSGNFDTETNERIWVVWELDTETGAYVPRRVEPIAETKVPNGAITYTFGPGDEDAVPFIPELNERTNLVSYSVTADLTTQRSQIIVGSTEPSYWDKSDPTFGASTSAGGFKIYEPPSATAPLDPSDPSSPPLMRGITRPAMYNNSKFTDPDEQRMMVELLMLHSWFAQRIGSVQAPANPCLGIDDQIKIVERQTDETYIHYVRSMRTMADLTTGSYTMSLETNWLGDANEWVFINPQMVEQNNEPYADMIVIGDSLSALGYTNGNLSATDRWVDSVLASGVITSFENSSIMGETTTSMRAKIESNDPFPVQPQSSDVFIVFLGANDVNTSVQAVQDLGVQLVTPDDYQTNLEWFLDNYPARRQIVMYPWRWTSSATEGIPVEENLYLQYRDAARAAALAKNAEFIDVGAVVADASAYQADGIHSNASGVALLADLVEQRLNASATFSGYDPISRALISDRLYNWTIKTERGVIGETSGVVNPQATVSLSFTPSVIQQDSFWNATGTITVSYPGLTNAVIRNGSTTSWLTPAFIDVAGQVYDWPEDGDIVYIGSMAPGTYPITITGPTSGDLYGAASITIEISADAMVTRSTTATLMVTQGTSGDSGTDDGGGPIIDPNLGNDWTFVDDGSDVGTPDVTNSQLEADITDAHQGGAYPYTPSTHEGYLYPTVSTNASEFVPRYPLDTPPGMVRFGVSFSSSSGVDEKWEDPIGKPLPMYRRFFSWTQATNGSMRTEVLSNYAAGRATWLSFKAPLSTTSWSEIAAGNYQIQVDAFLEGLRTTGVNCWLTPYHEPEDNCSPEAPGNDEHLDGTPAQWKAMIRYIEQRRQVIGADNVLIVPIYMDWTFNPASDRNINDFLLTDEEFPVLAFDPYTNDYDGLNITSPTFQYAVDALEATGKDIAVAECGGAINTSNVRPAGLWEAFAAEAVSRNFKAMCWFDIAGNDYVGVGSSGDPTGALYSAILESLDGPESYRDGLTGSGVVVGSGVAPGSLTIPNDVEGLGLWYLLSAEEDAQPEEAMVQVALGGFAYLRDGIGWTSVNFSNDDFTVTGVTWEANRAGYLQAKQTTGTIIDDIYGWSSKSATGISFGSATTNNDGSEATIRALGVSPIVSGLDIDGFEDSIAMAWWFKVRVIGTDEPAAYRFMPGLDLIRTGESAVNTANGYMGRARQLGANRQVGTDWEVVTAHTASMEQIQQYPPYVIPGYVETLYQSAESRTGTDTSLNPAIPPIFELPQLPTSDLNPSGGITVNFGGFSNSVPVAAFTMSDTAGSPPLQVTFTDTSTDTHGTIASRAWDFGDGGTSTALNPTHTFSTAGNYVVTLTVTDNDGAEAIARHSVSVSSGVNASPNAAFSYSPSSGEAPLSVSFYDESNDGDGTIASRFWEFGDGYTSTSDNPTHSYGSAGTYVVKLTVTDDQGATDYVTHTVLVSWASGQSSSNGASSFHLWWDGVGSTRFESAGVKLTVLEQPSDGDLMFWAFQVDFTDSSGVVTAGAHVGLQSWSSFSNTSNHGVNWGGYSSVNASGYSEGDTLDTSGNTDLGSQIGSAVSFNYPWVEGTEYSFEVTQVASGPSDPAGTTRWAATVFDGVSTDLIGELIVPGDRIYNCAMWTESFAACSDPSTLIRWSEFYGVVDGTSTVYYPDQFLVTYQSALVGGCHNTNSYVSGGDLYQQTNTARVTADNAIIQT